MSTTCGRDDHVVVEEIPAVVVVRKDNVASQELSVNTHETVSYADVTREATEDRNVPNRPLTTFWHSNGFVPSRRSWR